MDTRGERLCQHIDLLVAVTRCWCLPQPHPLKDKPGEYTSRAVSSLGKALPQPRQPGGQPLAPLTPRFSVRAKVGSSPWARNPGLKSVTRTQVSKANTTFLNIKESDQGSHIYLGFHAQCEFILGFSKCINQMPLSGLPL